LLLGLWSSPGRALPSFATQTGYACADCHTTAFGPQLSPLGQSFKLGGYLWNQGNSQAPPLAAFVLSSFTHTQQGQPGGAAPGFHANDNLAPDQVSVFYAGRIASRVGAFIQGTYDGVARRFHWDNLDVRYADKIAWGSSKIAYGASLNNNPTVQDLWNSTPAWAWPFVSSALAPRPAAAPVIEGGLAQKVLGLTGYSMIDGRLYLEAGGYRTLSQHTQQTLGIDPSGQAALQDIATYWRAALRHSDGPHDGSLGLFGLSGRTRPAGTSGGPDDRFTDLGYDATYEYNPSGPHGLSANFTYVHELRRQPASVALGGASATSAQIDTLRFNAGYVYRRTWSLSGGPFIIRGDTDPLAFAAAPLTGSASGSPDSRGWIGQIELIPFGKKDSPWRPLLNLRFGLQYTLYTQFNGGSRNYDGSGRNASGNDTLYAFLWAAL
jgi:hypothetical protein